ncbi:MAG TPA: DUF4124 domain-containing protein [Burkholderiales bacterium]|nr:DUF4124 domain-containing protein [Burkholderiales bacterium]
MSPVISAAAVVLALAASTALAGDPIYKSIMPDGRVLYGEAPAPGAKRVDKVATGPEHAGIVVASPDDKGRAANIHPEPGGVTVIPQKPTYPARPAQQGYSASGQLGTKY